MDNTLKIVRYTLAAQMARVSFILNSNAATLHISDAELDQTAVTTNVSESDAEEVSRS